MRKKINLQTLSTDIYSLNTFVTCQQLNVYFVSSRKLFQGLSVGYFWWLQKQ